MAEESEEPRKLLRREGLVEEDVSLVGVAEAPLASGAVAVRLRTTKGELPAVLHPAGKPGGVIWLSGARGGLNGPSGGLYATLGYALTDAGITSLRLHYRRPNSIPSCVADVAVAIDYLEQRGVNQLVLVGHSFGAAVAITAGALSPAVVAVATLAGQTFGTELVPDLSPRPLLIVHGTWDLNLDFSCAENLYRRAQEPKRLVLFPGASHSLVECQEDLEDLLSVWVVDNVGQERPLADWYRLAPIAFPVSRRPRKEIRLCLGDITDFRADGLVCPANEALTMWEGVAAAISRQGGGAIVLEAANLAPRRPGEAVATSAGLLPAKAVIHAVVTAPRQGVLLPDEQTVASAARSCLAAAEELQLQSLAFPTMGAVGPISLERMATILTELVFEGLKATSHLRTVTFVVGGAGAFRAFAGAMSKLPLNGRREPVLSTDAQRGC